jgi:ATP-binding cassette subfamily B protein
MRSPPRTPGRGETAGTTDLASQALLSLRVRFRTPSSRARYRSYKSKLKEQRRRGEPVTVDLHASPDARPPQKRTRTAFALLRRFFGLLGGFRGRIVAALATLTVATMLSLLQPAATKIVVDYVLIGAPLPEGIPSWLPVPRDPLGLLTAVAIALVSIAAVSITISLWGRWQATKTVAQLKPVLRRKIFERAVRLPLHRVQELKTGGAASLLRDDAGNVGHLVFAMVYNPWRAIIQLTGSLCVLAWVDWRLLLGSLLLIPTVFLTHRTWINRIRPLYKDIHANRQTIDSQVTETFGGIRIVRSFGRAKSEAVRYLRADHYRARQEVHVWWWARGVDIAWSLLIPLASAALLWYGGREVLAGHLSVGDLVMFLAYLAMLLDPLATLATSATEFQSGLAGLDRVLDLLEEPAEMPDEASAIALAPSQVHGRIVFDNVTFTYPGGARPAVRNINLEVGAGQTIAFVGPSGAGKTTLCNLIARFYDPSEGAITLDGIDLRSIRLDSFRKLLGIVEQDIFLFDGSVAENIGYARRDADIDQIVRAATLAHADEFIDDLPQKYDTMIGERGVKLSGGQRQRLAIARAILADPRILILDEATSNLDTASERFIQQSLASLMKGRTSFVIAHRLSTIRQADQIVVVEDSRIVEQGKHDELLARSGKYQKMVMLQTQPEALPLLDEFNGETKSQWHERTTSS